MGEASSHTRGLSDNGRAASAKRLSVAERAVAHYEPGTTVVVEDATGGKFHAEIDGTFECCGVKCYRTKRGRETVRVVAERILGVAK